MKLTEAVTVIITNIIIETDTIKVPKLSLLRACVRIVTPYFKLQLTEAVVFGQFSVQGSYSRST